MVYYLNPVRAGLDQVTALGDGYTINLKWFQAYPHVKTNKIAYNIYYSTEKDDVFVGPPKYVSITEDLEVNIIDLVPGQLYNFSVRPVEYNPTEVDLTILPIAYDNLRFYPTSLLRSDIDRDDLIIPLLDTEGFPNSGIIKIGAELIQYLSVDTVNNNLVLTDASTQRGVDNTYAVSHTTDGYDGYETWDPSIYYFITGETMLHDRIFECLSRFEYPNYPYTATDGYHQVNNDILTTDLSSSDDFNVDFPTYDYAGYHRTDPVQLLNGTCVGSYIGGEMYCLDQYGVGQVVRGFSLQEHNNQRQELLLEVTGRPAVLIKRVHTGITCSCYLSTSEYADDRCPNCLGSKYVLGWEQYFNPRRSDGRILVRPTPSDENLKMTEAGLESDFPLELWTLTAPTIKNRDIIIMFDMDNNEEFRYEVLSVTRNNTIVGLQGGQKLRVQRIRKTDSAYQIRTFRDTSSYPSKINTSISSAASILPHTHTITKNELDQSQWSQTTSVAQGHNHVVVIENGQLKVLPALGHTHTIII